MLQTNLGSSRGGKKERNIIYETGALRPANHRGSRAPCCRCFTLLLLVAIHCCQSLIYILCSKSDKYLPPVPIISLQPRCKQHDSSSCGESLQEDSISFARRCDGRLPLGSQLVLDPSYLRETTTFSYVPPPPPNLLRSPPQDPWISALFFTKVSVFSVLKFS